MALSQPATFNEEWSDERVLPTSTSFHQQVLMLQLPCALSCFQAYASI